MKSKCTVPRARCGRGIASLAVDDPSCKADRQVITCVDTDSTQGRWALFTVSAAAMRVNGPRPRGRAGWPEPVGIRPPRSFQGELYVGLRPLGRQQCRKRL